MDDYRDDSLEAVQARVKAAPLRVKATMSLISELLMMVSPKEAITALVLTVQLLSAHIRENDAKGINEVKALEDLMNLPEPPEGD